MATVSIDIPGIGTVEAENAASESTLRELVNAIKSGGGSSGSGSGGGNATSKNAQATQKSTSRLNQFANTAGRLNAGFVKLGTASTKLVSDFADVGDSLTSAASMFSSIPLIGTVFSSVAKAATTASDSLIAGAASGATFDGSIRSFSRSASEAGLTLDQFGSFLSSNGAALVALGGETSEGAKRFSVISKQIRTTGQDLFALGFSTQTINEGFANYAKQLRMQGLSEGRTNQDLAQGAQDYLKEMDALAKITGEERKAKEGERERLLADAQFQASMAGLQEDVRKSFTNTVGQLPKGLQDFTKDILATGTATTAENQKLMAMMPRSAEMLSEMNSRMQRGEAITLEERNQLNNLMRAEGGAALQSIKFAGAASADLAPLVNSLTDTQKLQLDGVLKSIESQDKASEQTDAFNQSVQESKAALAGFSNEFMVALADSGVLPVMMEAFSTAANLMIDYVVPIFQLVGDNISGLIGTFLAFKGIMLAVNIATGVYNGLMLLANSGLLGLNIALSPFTAAVLAAVAGIGLLVAGMVFIKNQFFASWGDVWEALVDSFTRLKLSVSKIFGGLNDAEKKELAELDKRREEREKRKEEQDKAEEKTSDEKNKLQAGEIKARKQNLQSMESTNKKLDKERQKSVDYSTTDAVSLLGQELKAQQSSLSGAEGTKKDIEKERAQEKAKATEAKEESKPDSTKASEASVEKTGSDGLGDQKSATELLAALNTKLDALLRVSGAQLQVQRNLSSDMFA